MTSGPKGGREEKNEEYYIMRRPIISTLHKILFERSNK
jgi:hypothetical protein